MGDTLLLYAGTCCCLILILFSFRFSRIAGAVHLLVLLAYSSYGYYGLFEWSKGKGNALAWFFYLLMALIAHSLILLVYIIARLLRSRQN